MWGELIMFMLSIRQRTCSEKGKFNPLQKFKYLYEMESCTCLANRYEHSDAKYLLSSVSAL